MYGFKTKHTCTLSLFISGCEIQNELAGIYKILWGSIFQGCYGQGKVRGKQIIFKVGQKSGKIFDIVSVRNNSANSITLHSKSWKWKGLESEDRNIDGLQKKPKQM